MTESRILAATILRCSRYEPTDYAACAFCGSVREEHPPAALVWHAAPELADALEDLLVYVPGQIGDRARAALKKAGRLP